MNHRDTDDLQRNGPTVPDLDPALELALLRGRLAVAEGLVSILHGALDSASPVVDKSDDEEFAYQHELELARTFLEESRRLTEAAATMSGANDSAASAQLTRAREVMDLLPDQELVSELQRRGVIHIALLPQDLVEAGRAADEGQASRILANVIEDSSPQELLTEGLWRIVDDVVEQSGDWLRVSLKYDLSGELQALAMRTSNGDYAAIDDSMWDKLVDLRVLADAKAVSVHLSHGSQQVEVSDYATWEGARRWLEEQGFSLSRQLRVTSTDTGDDSPPLFNVKALVPVDFLLDADACGRVDSNIAETADRHGSRGRQRNGG